MTDCGPGILWSVMPLELVVEGLVPPMPALAEVVVEGRVIQVEPGEDGTGRVVRLLSTDPQDYLDPRFQPGRRIRMVQAPSAERAP